MKSLLYLMLPVAFPALLASPLPEKAELLASNTVVAQYVTTELRPCHGRTALCPDRCAHAVKVARFRVLSNESYEQYGPYGDDKAAAGNLMLIDAGADVPGQPEGIIQKLAGLKPGQVVHMTQKHYYAELEGCHSPVRPITQLEVLHEGACKEILPEPQDPANHDHEVMPLPL